MGVFTAATLVAANRFAAHAGRDVPSATATAVGVLALHGLVLWLEPRLAGRLRRKVRFFKSQVQAIGWTNVAVHWPKLRSFSWERHAAWQVLELRARDGGRLRLGVPLDAPTGEISAWLTGRGLTDERLT